MTVFERLQSETANARQRFHQTPILQHALQQGVNLPLYLAYLQQAYHHVRYTCPLLGLTVARTGDDDAWFRAALYEYIEEEKGHENWILDDIEALGGNRAAIVASTPNDACRMMIGYVHYAIEHISPYAMLGMVHVLEGTAVTLADVAAQKIRSAIGAGETGFSYLTSHGAIDISHVAFFEKVVNAMWREADIVAMIDTARIVYRLFGEMFTDVAANLPESSLPEINHAA